MNNLNTIDGQQSSFSRALITSVSMKEHGRGQSGYSPSIILSFISELTAEALFHG